MNYHQNARLTLKQKEYIRNSEESIASHHPCLPAEALSCRQAGLAQAGTNGQKEETVWKIYYPDYPTLAESLTIWVNNYNLTTKLRSIPDMFKILN